MTNWTLTMNLQGITPFDPFEPPEPPPRPRSLPVPLATTCRSLRRPRGAGARRHGCRHAKAADGDDPPSAGLAPNQGEG